MFGGYLSNSGQYSNDVIKINLAKIENGTAYVKLIKNEENKIPSPRANCSACSFNGSFYIFGGTNSNDFFDDFWKFNFESESWENLTI